MKKKKQKKFVITKEQLRKLQKAADRLDRLARGIYSPTSVHRSSKKDKLDKSPNTIKHIEE